MMYPYMTLADETEIVHSQIIEKDGQNSKEISTVGDFSTVLISYYNITKFYFPNFSERCLAT